MDGALILVAAYLAGIVNAIAGGGTVLSFSALLAIGLDPRIANATSATAILPGSLGGALGFRSQITEARGLLLRLLLPSLLGGWLGAALLVWTPSPLFGRLVPFLVLFATVLFMLQDSLPQPAERETGVGILAWLYQFAVGVYGGYFGAGIGILMLAMLGVIGVRDIYQANGLKNLLAAAMNGVAIAAFIVLGMVSWPHALVMAGGALLGGYSGARASQFVGRTAARRAVIVVGLSLFCWTAAKYFF